MEPHNMDDVINKLNEKYFDYSKTLNNDEDYLEAYSIMLLQITANYISIIRSMCREQENQELGTELEKWFNSSIDLFTDDLAEAIYGIKYGDKNPAHLRFILARLATSPLLFTIILGDQTNPESVNTNVITDDLIRRVSAKSPK